MYREETHTEEPHTRMYRLEENHLGLLMYQLQRKLTQRKLTLACIQRKLTLP